MLNKRVVKGSLILLIAFGLFNLLNFLYQFAMARMLSVSDYGILATLFAITYIFSIFAESIQTIIAKYTVESKNEGQLKNLLKRSLKKGKQLANISFLAYLAVSVLIYFLFEIEFILLALNGLILYFMFLMPVSRGIIQGKKRFFSLGTNLIVESGMKLLLGIIFVMLGWRVYGAIGGFTLGAFVAYLASFLPIRDVSNSKEENFKQDNIYSYAKPTIFITAVIVVFYSIDVLIAKFFFSPELVGAYAIASILGKIVLWACVPIGKVMFPLSTESKDNRLGKKRIFLTTIFILLSIIVLVLAIFYFWSDFIVSIFSGKSIPDASRVLFYLGIAFSLVAISNIVLLYQLSIGKTKGYKILGLAIIIELMFLILSQVVFGVNISNFAISFLVSSIVLLISSIVFTHYNRH